jgi:4a-hydroxytetrahydrobiopterin dehydratase
MRAVPSAPAVMMLSYSKCVVRWSTHAIGGLSDNDFICAAKVDLLTV